MSKKTSEPGSQPWLQHLPCHVVRSLGDRQASLLLRAVCHANVARLLNAFALAHLMETRASLSSDALVSLCCFVERSLLHLSAGPMEAAISRVSGLVAYLGRAQARQRQLVQVTLILTVPIAICALSPRIKPRPTTGVGAIMHSTERLCGSSTEQRHEPPALVSWELSRWQRDDLGSSSSLRGGRPLDGLAWSLLENTSALVASIGSASEGRAPAMMLLVPCGGPSLRELPCLAHDDFDGLAPFMHDRKQATQELPPPIISHGAALALLEQRSDHAHERQPGRPSPSPSPSPPQEQDGVACPPSSGDGERRPLGYDALSDRAELEIDGLRGADDNVDAVGKKQGQTHEESNVHSQQARLSLEALDGARADISTTPTVLHSHSARQLWSQWQAEAIDWKQHVCLLKSMAAWMRTGVADRCMPMMSEWQQKQEWAVLPLDVSDQAHVFTLYKPWAFAHQQWRFATKALPKARYISVLHSLLRMEPLAGLHSRWDDGLRQEAGLYGPARSNDLTTERKHSLNSSTLWCKTHFQDKWTRMLSRRRVHSHPSPGRWRSDGPLRTSELALGMCSLCFLPLLVLADWLSACSVLAQAVSWNRLEKTQNLDYLDWHSQLCISAHCSTLSVDQELRFETWYDNTPQLLRRALVDESVQMPLLSGYPDKDLSIPFSVEKQAQLRDENADPFEDFSESVDLLVKLAAHTVECWWLYLLSPWYLAWRGSRYVSHQLAYSQASEVIAAEQEYFVPFLLSSGSAKALQSISHNEQIAQAEARHHEAAMQELGLQHLRQWAQSCDSRKESSGACNWRALSVYSRLLCSLDGLAPRLSPDGGCVATCAPSNIRRATKQVNRKSPWSLPEVACQLEFDSTHTHRFLFIGPEGAGKSYLAKSLAATANMPFMCIDKITFLYSHKHAVNRLGPTDFDLVDAQTQTRHDLRFSQPTQASRAKFDEVVTKWDEVVICSTQPILRRLSLLFRLLKGLTSCIVWMPELHMLSKAHRKLALQRSAYTALLVLIQALRYSLPPDGRPGGKLLVLGGSSEVRQLDPILVHSQIFARIMHVRLPNRAHCERSVRILLRAKQACPSTHTRWHEVGNRLLGYHWRELAGLIDEALRIHVDERTGSIHTTTLQSAMQRQSFEELNITADSLFSSLQGVPQATVCAQSSDQALLISQQTQVAYYHAGKAIVQTLFVAAGSMFFLDTYDKALRAREFVFSKIRLSYLVSEAEPSVTELATLPYTLSCLAGSAARDAWLVFQSPIAGGGLTHSGQAIDDVRLASGLLQALFAHIAHPAIALQPLGGWLDKFRLMDNCFEHPLPPLASELHWQTSDAGTVFGMSWDLRPQRVSSCRSTLLQAGVKHTESQVMSYEPSSVAPMFVKKSLNIHRRPETGWLLLHECTLEYKPRTPCTVWAYQGRLVRAFEASDHTSYTRSLYLRALSIRKRWDVLRDYPVIRPEKRGLRSEHSGYGMDRSHTQASLASDSLSNTSTELRASVMTRSRLQAFKQRQVARKLPNMRAQFFQTAGRRPDLRLDDFGEAHFREHPTPLQHPQEQAGQAWMQSLVYAALVDSYAYMLRFFLLEYTALSQIVQTYLRQRVLLTEEVEAQTVHNWKSPTSTG